MNKHGDSIVLLHFFNVHIMNVNYAKFQKSLIVEKFQGNYLKWYIWISHLTFQVAFHFPFQISCFISRFVLRFILLIKMQGKSWSFGCPLVVLRKNTALILNILFHFRWIIRWKTSSLSRDKRSQKLQPTINRGISRWLFQPASKATWCSHYSFSGCSLRILGHSYCLRWLFRSLHGDNFW